MDENKQTLNYKGAKHGKVLRKVGLNKAYSIKGCREAVHHSLALTAVSVTPAITVSLTLLRPFLREQNLQATDFHIMAAAQMLCSQRGKWWFTIPELVKLYGLDARNTHRVVRKLMRRQFLSQCIAGESGDVRTYTRQQGQAILANRYTMTVNGHAMLSMFYDKCADLLRSWGL